MVARIRAVEPAEPGVLRALVRDGAGAGGAQMRAVAAAVLLFSKALDRHGRWARCWSACTSDLLAPMHRRHSLRVALLLVPLFNLWAVVHFFARARHLRADLARATEILPPEVPVVGAAGLSPPRVG